MLHNSCVREGQKKAQNKTKQTNIKKKKREKKTSATTKVSEKGEGCVLSTRVDSTLQPMERIM